MDKDPIKDMISAVNKTYVYDNVEIRKTGKTAERKLSSGKLDKLYEITPADSSVGSWKKWVREVELYEVSE